MAAHPLRGCFFLSAQSACVKLPDGKMHSENHRRALSFSCDVVMRRDAHPKIPHEDEEPSLEAEVLGMNDPIVVAGSLFPWGLESVHGSSLFTVPGPRSRVSGNLALQMLYGVAARFWSLFRGVGHRQFWAMS